MSASANLEATLMSVAASALDVPREGLSLDSGSHDLAAWDSLGHVTLVDAVEEAFGVSFPASEIVAFETLRDVRDALSRHGVGA